MSELEQQTKIPPYYEKVAEDVYYDLFLGHFVAFVNGYRFEIVKYQGHEFNIPIDPDKADFKDKTWFKSLKHAMKIASWLRKETERRREKNANLPPDKMPRLLKPSGFVYLLQSTSGYFKIGKTKKPDQRIKTFGVKLPFEVEYMALIQCADMTALENELHKRYADKRVNGEWFALDADDVAYIKALAGGGS